MLRHARPGPSRRPVTRLVVVAGPATAAGTTADPAYRAFEPLLPGGPGAAGPVPPPVPDGLPAGPSGEIEWP